MEELIQEQSSCVREDNSLIEDLLWLEYCKYKPYLAELGL